LQPAPAALAAGVQIAGYLNAELGVGELARLMTTAVEFGGHPLSTFCYEDTVSRKEHPAGPPRAGSFDINLICVNADRIGQFVRHAGARFFDERYSVGLWNWELEQFPQSLCAGFDFVDEVWAPTDFVARSVRAADRKPVFTMPPPLGVPFRRPEITRAALGLPGRFMFLFMFDFLSILERKNPLGTIRAFTRAFSNGEGPLLVLKSMNGHRCVNDLEALRAAIDGRSDIRLIENCYPVDLKNALLAECDCYVSLHRSEGLGLTMAEAMALGKPVIATGYSGNLHFMTHENSYLVDYALTEVPPGCDPYPSGAVWAEPDIAMAAAFMRRVHQQPEQARRKARLGQQDILLRHNLDISARAVTERLETIRAHRTELPIERGSERPLARFRRLARGALARALKPDLSQADSIRPESARALTDMMEGMHADVHAQVQSLSRELRACLEDVQRLQMSLDLAETPDTARRGKANRSHERGHPVVDDVVA
jgi:hypothetical protein